MDSDLSSQPLNFPQTRRAKAQKKNNNKNTEIYKQTKIKDEIGWRAVAESG